MWQGLKRRPAVLLFGEVEKAAVFATRVRQPVAADAIQTVCTTLHAVRVAKRRDSTALSVRTMAKTMTATVFVAKLVVNHEEPMESTRTLVTMTKTTAAAVMRKRRTLSLLITTMVACPLHLEQHLSFLLCASVGTSTSRGNTTADGLSALRLWTMTSSH